jgi:hypothetical protein
MRNVLGIAALAVLIAASISGGIAGIVPYNQQRVLEATALMEQLATKLEHAKRIAPETKFEIARLIRQPWYDCSQVACRTALETRNRAARARLQTVTAVHTEQLSAKQEKISINTRH